MKPFANPQSILITGASSGIGEGLALHYAKPGVTLFLGGRDKERLDAVAAACAEKGAEAIGESVDVTDRDGMTDWITRCNDHRLLNLVIANAGIAVGTKRVSELHDAVMDCYEINVNGVFNTIHPALEVMSKRQPYPVTDAQIGIVSSIMGYIGTARSPAYSSSKATIKSYGQALRGAFREMGIGVTVICPGYVRSRLMGPDMKGYPFMIEVDEASRTIAKALACNKARITFPWQILLIGRLAINLPGWIIDRLNKPYGVPRFEETETQAES